MVKILEVYVNSGVGYVRITLTYPTVSVKRTYPTPDSGLTHLFHGRGRSVV